MSDVYQLRVYLRGVSPMVWRRLLIRSDSTIADLHYMLQTVMNWEDMYLHEFLIRSKRYGISKIGDFGFMDDADDVSLAQFNFRPNEKFFYRYNFYDEWLVEIRVEQRLPFDSQKKYPLCIGGKRAAPPDGCGGAWRFMELKQHYSLWFIEERLLEILDTPDFEENRWDYAEEIENYLYWLQVNHFDRRKTNQQLKEYRMRKWRLQGNENSSPNCH